MIKTCLDVDIERPSAEMVRFVTNGWGTGQSANAFTGNPDGDVGDNACDRDGGIWIPLIPPGCCDDPRALLNRRCGAKRAIRRRVSRPPSGATSSRSPGSACGVDDIAEIRSAKPARASPTTAPLEDNPSARSRVDTTALFAVARAYLPA